MKFWRMFIQRAFSFTVACVFAFLSGRLAAFVIIRAMQGKQKEEESLIWQRANRTVQGGYYHEPRP